MRMQLRIVAALLLVATFQLLTVNLGADSFQEPGGGTYLTDDGTVLLVWGESSSEPGGGKVHEVRRWDAGGPSEGTYVYEGEDTASFVSGLNEGEYTFRIRSKERGGVYPEWGDESLVVTVDYIDMGIVWPLMGAGSVCIVVLILTIVLGRRAVNREERA
jgi:hypothetical protein